MICFAMLSRLLFLMNNTGKDESGSSNKNLWPPQESTASPPPEKDNPLFKLLMDVSSSQESLMEDHLLLTNRFNLHHCSDYCL